MICGRGIVVVVGSRRGVVDVVVLNISSICDLFVDVVVVLIVFVVVYGPHSLTGSEGSPTTCYGEFRCLCDYVN